MGRASDMLHRTRAWLRGRLPPGVRLVLGVLLFVGGLFGFLPILGFWMIPLGIAVAALDLGPILRKIRGETAPPDTPSHTASRQEEPEPPRAPRR